MSKTKPVTAGEIQGLVERAMALANAATRGPWTIEDPMGPDTLWVVEAGKQTWEWHCLAMVSIDDNEGHDPVKPILAKERDANAAFIAASRQLIPELCEAITRLSQPAEEIREAGMPNPFDYTALDGGALLDKLGDDAAQWAAAFNQHAVKLGYAAMDEGWLIGWFANAIEHSSDVRHCRGKPVVLPDGSSFSIGASSGSNKSDEGKKGQPG